MIPFSGSLPWFILNSFPRDNGVIRLLSFPVFFSLLRMVLTLCHYMPDIHGSSWRTVTIFIPDIHGPSGRTVTIFHMDVEVCVYIENY